VQHGRLDGIPDGSTEGLYGIINDQISIRFFLGHAFLYPNELAIDHVKLRVIPAADVQPFYHLSTGITQGLFAPVRYFLQFYPVFFIFDGLFQVSVCVREEALASEVCDDLFLVFFDARFSVCCFYDFNISVYLIGI
jgi:hypothetical protein